MFCFDRCIACVVCVLLGTSVDAATPLQQCRENQAGDIAVANCLSLQHEETEVALAGIEESLGNLLGTTHQGKSIGGTLIDFWDQSKAPEQTPTAPASSDRQVIAIIGGIATAIDESVAADDDSPPGADATPQDKPLQPDPLIDFDAERRHYRVYRDNRCSWQARIFEPGETAWREISCRVELNRQRVEDLRAQLNRRLNQKSLGFSVRGFLSAVPTGLSFQPCGSSRQWPVSADSELSLTDRWQSLAGSTGPPVYAELSGSRLQTGTGSGLAATELLQLRVAVAGDCELDTSSSTLSASQVLPDDRQMAATLSAPPEHDISGSATAPDQDHEAAVSEAIKDTTVNSSPSVSEDKALASAPSNPTKAGPGTLANASDNLMYGYFQGWAAACSVGAKQKCRAFSDAEPTRENTWQLQINQAAGGGYEIILLPRSQDVRIGRDVLIYVDRKPVADRRLSAAETRLKTATGVVLKRGENAQSLLQELRRGTSLLVRWTDYSNVQTDVNFTLWGLSRALKFKPNP